MYIQGVYLVLQNPKRNQNDFDIQGVPKIFQMDIQGVSEVNLDIQGVAILKKDIRREGEEGTKNQ